MEKERADALITEYLPKIYGFACKKAFSYDESEELAAQMTAEVYGSFLARDEIYNVEGYVWRICEHTYARYVADVKKHAGVSIDSIGELPYEQQFDSCEDDMPDILRREVAFLSAARREIVFRFYYKNEPIKQIAARMSLPEGTVKWHLNKARNELKEGLKMERKIGKLGISPVTAMNLGHDGNPGSNAGTEYYLGDKLNLNIAYSCYHEPKNVTEIAEELGVAPAYIEDKVEFLESNGFLVRTKDDRFTTYVLFSPRTWSKERVDAELGFKQRIAQRLAKEYAPAVIAAAREMKDVYTPGGNRELFEAAAVFYAISEKVDIGAADRVDISRYFIKTAAGGSFIANAVLESECEDPDYVMQHKGDYVCCGAMTRFSSKYAGVASKAWDTRFDSRKGGWKNNLTADYDHLYEYITGRLADKKANAEKLGRLKDRGFIGKNGEVNVMIAKSTLESFCAAIPAPDKKLAEEFAESALENALNKAKQYPPQMQDLIVYYNSNPVRTDCAMMVLDILYSDGTFKPLAERERVAANLIMFSDVLPE